MSWMRQKSEYDRDIAPPAPPAPARSAAPPVATREAAPASVSSHINIGQSIQIKGTLVGMEDLTIDGKVEGKIRLKDHVLTIGAHGAIDAEVHAKTVVVHGKLTGNVSADDKVEIASTGSVRGDIRAPRVAIQDGASFKGGIDMEGGGRRERQAAEQPKETAGPPAV